MTGVRLMHTNAPELKALEESGVEPANLYRALAHRATLLDAWLSFASAVRGQCSTPRRIRELIILRSAQLSASGYIWSDHVPMAVQAGASLEQIAALHRWYETSLFSAAERATLTFADQISSTSDVSESCLAALADHFDEGERVELALTAGFYAMVPRVLAALRVPLPDRPPGPVPFPAEA